VLAPAALILVASPDRKGTSPMTVTRTLKTTTAATEPLATEVLIGAQAIADEIGIDLRKCFHWLESGFIPATKTGRTWTTTKRRLRKHFDGA
jgi:hypothetical protein